MASRKKPTKRKPGRRPSMYGPGGTLHITHVTAAQRRLLDRARDIDDLYPMRVDALRSERAQAFRDCRDGGLSTKQIAAHLGKNRTVVERWVRGPLPIQKWQDPEASTPEGEQTA